MSISHNFYPRSSICSVPCCRPRFLVFADQPYAAVSHTRTHPVPWSHAQRNAALRLGAGTVQSALLQLAFGLASVVLRQMLRLLKIAPVTFTYLNIPNECLRVSTTTTKSQRVVLFLSIYVRFVPIPPTHIHYCENWCCCFCCFCCFIGVPHAFESEVPVAAVVETAADHVHRHHRTALHVEPEAENSLHR